MQNSIISKLVIIILLISSNTLAQNGTQTTIFNHSDKYSLDNKQTEIYNVVTRQSDVKNPKIIEYKSYLSLMEYDRLELNIDLGKSIIAKYDKIVHQNEKHWTWFGTVTEKYKDQGYAFITLNGDNLSGEIWTLDYMYRIIPLGNNKGILFEIDFTKIDGDESCGVGSEKLNYKLNTQNIQTINDVVSANVSTGITYDALVCYTVAARVGAGGTTAMHSLIDDMIAKPTLFMTIATLIH